MAAGLMPPVRCKLAERNAVLDRVLPGCPGPCRTPDPAGPRYFIGVGIPLSVQRDVRKLYGHGACRMHALPRGYLGVQCARTGAGSCSNQADAGRARRSRLGRAACRRAQEATVVCPTQEGVYKTWHGRAHVEVNFARRGTERDASIVPYGLHLPAARPVGGNPMRAGRDRAGGWGAVLQLRRRG